MIRMQRAHVHAVNRVGRDQVVYRGEKAWFATLETGDTPGERFGTARGDIADGSNLKMCTSFVLQQLIAFEVSRGDPATAHDSNPDWFGHFFSS